MSTGDQHVRFAGRVQADRVSTPRSRRTGAGRPPPTCTTRGRSPMIAVTASRCIRAARSG